MRFLLFLICFSALVVQICYWKSTIIPKSNYKIPQPVEMILVGKTPLREVFRNKELLKEVYNALGDETPIGLQFETLSRRFYPLQKEVLKNNNLIAPVYYTLNDWALGTLEYIPFKDLPIKAEENWKNEVSKVKWNKAIPESVRSMALKEAIRIEVEKENGRLVFDDERLFNFILPIRD